MKKIIQRGYCIEANGLIQMGQAEIPYYWNESEKEVAQDFMDSEYVKDDKPKLVKVVIMRQR